MGCYQQWLRRVLKKKPSKGQDGGLSDGKEKAGGRPDDQERPETHFEAEKTHSKL